MAQREVYLNEYNVLMEGSAYLPLVSGTLQVYAETFPEVVEHYRFMPYLFHRDDPDRLVARYRNPSVAAFSVSMWNEQLNLRVAEGVKRRWPDCLVVFGGPQVPYEATDYLGRNPFIDVTVRSEGEEAFADILRRFLEGRDFRDIPGISWRDPRTGACVKNAKDREQAKDLDVYPSPYLSGKYEPLIAAHPEIDFQAIIETNRGCPFPCTFCFWGQGGLSMKYRYYGMDRVRKILDWCGKNRIRYVFNADSNFGMIQRDYEIAEYLVEIKRRYGFPEKFRTCFGKNSGDKIFRIGALLHEHGMEKGITLARQSNDPETLKNVRRENIKLSTYRALQIRYNEREIPVYTELILGLPGETSASWVDGIEEALQSGIKNQLFCYFCQVYPNTEMDRPEYRERFGIRTAKVPLNEIHGAVRPEGSVPEIEEIVISTSSMTVEDWRRMTVYSWTVQMLYSLKLTFYVLAYLVRRYGLRYADFLEHICALREGIPGTLLGEEIERFGRRAQAISEGAGRGVVMPEFGAIYLEEEEAGFLRIVQARERFYDELPAMACAFLASRGIPHDPNEVGEAVLYQRMRVAAIRGVERRTHVFERNMPEYMEALFLERPVPLEQCRQRMVLVSPVDYGGDKRRFMRDRLLFGRKSGTILYAVSWESLDPVRVPIAS